MPTIIRYRMAVVLLTAALLATLTVALTGGDRADAVDGPVETVYVATGRDFPDALAGSTLAVTAGAPMLTVEPRLPLPPATIEALEALDPNTIIVFGGPGAVPPEVTDALVPYARSGEVTRIAGDDRHDTAAQIADALPDRVADADLLDGLDSTDFLRTTDADSLSSTVYELELLISPSQETIPLSAVGADTAMEILRVEDVPAGTYLVSGQITAVVTVDGGATESSNVNCRTSIGDAVSDTAMRIGTNAGYVKVGTMPVSLTATIASPSDVSVACWAGDQSGARPAINVREFTGVSAVRLG